MSDNKEKPEKKTLWAAVDKEVHEKLVELAEEEERSISQVTARTLREHFFGKKEPEK